ncbi:MAG: trypsin-like peptidase domain-containing protein [Defluviitaleaceae bacterium]|nr:trypsin-like peptidase domain-containing protein [Defluviitaleaceae bacterium]
MNNYNNYEGYYYEPPKSKKKKNKWGKFLALGLTAVLASGSFGFGLGLGGAFHAENTSYNISTEAAQPLLGLAADLILPTISETPGFLASPLAAAPESTVVSVIREASYSVVSINTSIISRDFFNRPMARPGAGSGIISSADEDYIYIITNYHVIENAQSVEISLDDYVSVAASLVGSDRESDIAVIKVSRGDMEYAGIDNYKIAVFGDASLIEVGQTVIAIGNAMGQGQSATLGIVSAKGRTIPTEFNTILETIQTDAAINGGNSGGALVNLRGEVIGVNTAKLQGLGVEGMGFAIPSNSVKEIFNEIMERSNVQRPFLGIARGATVDEELKEGSNLPALGVFVAEVSRNSGAAAAGMQAGDIITNIGGVEILTIEQLTEFIPQIEVGTIVDIIVVRSDRNGTRELILSAEIRDANAPRSF